MSEISFTNIQKIPLGLYSNEKSVVISKSAVIHNPQEDRYPKFGFMKIRVKFLDIRKHDLNLIHHMEIEVLLHQRKIVDLHQQQN